MGYRKTKSSKNNRKQSSAGSGAKRRCSKCGQTLLVRSDGGMASPTGAYATLTVEYYCPRCKKSKGSDTFFEEY